MSSDSFWLQDARVLVDCAMGRSPADLVIRDGQWISVQTGEVIPHTDVAVASGRVAFVGPDATHTIGPTTRVIQAEGRFLVPRARSSALAMMFRRARSVRRKEAGWARSDSSSAR